MSCSDIPEAMQRTALLTGREGLERIRRGRVIVFGVGGVGSWCAEALARAGVGVITVVDSDTVAPGNINRQLVADFTTVGRLKATVMAQRIHAVNPDCHIHAVAGRYDAVSADSFSLDSYDVIVDAIDSVDAKADLIIRATRCRRARLVSSMGAALKPDITAIAVAEFNKAYGCALARALRNRFKKTGMFPARKFKCVYCPQSVANHAECAEAETDATPNGTKRVNGTLVTTTATFGLLLAQLALERLMATND